MQKSIDCKFAAAVLLSGKHGKKGVMEEEYYLYSWNRAMKPGNKPGLIPYGTV
jgi:hypothetical protein